jgi:hypothetical protein
MELRRVHVFVPALCLIQQRGKLLMIEALWLAAHLTLLIKSGV